MKQYPVKMTLLVLSLLFVSSFVFSQDATEAPVMDEVTTDALVEDTSDELDSILDTVQQTLQDLSENSEGDAQQFFTIMSDYVNDIGVLVEKWGAYVDEFQATDFKDFSGVRNEESYTRYLVLLDSLGHYTAIYKDILASPAELKRRLAPLGENNPYVVGAILGYTKDKGGQKDLFLEYLDHQVTSAGILKEILTLLHDKQKQWSYEGGEFVYTKRKLKKQASALMEEYELLQDKMTTLSSAMQ